MSEPFIAEIRIVPYNFAPRGWAFCDGQLLPTGGNEALYSLVGSTYGGNGRTTFGLPDLQNRAPMHPGSGPGLTLRRLGERIGTGSVTLQESQIASHAHDWKNAVNPPITPKPTEMLPSRHVDDDLEKVYKLNPTLDADFAAAQAGSSGHSQPHDNMQPCLGLHFTIALTGVYPSRS